MQGQGAQNLFTPIRSARCEGGRYSGFATESLVSEC